MSVSKQMMMEESERIEREEYDEDGYPKEGSGSISEMMDEIWYEPMKAKKILDKE
tara:strand:+ start:150 stop:314 length:165 start_codon:yes stop_codon:yes gene_type:complete